MERTIKVLNQMKSEGVILDYALGGAVAALFYMEPIETHDLDVEARVSSRYHGRSGTAPKIG